MDGLQGKVALVTGGASGIGEATAQLLVKYGVKVAIADIQDEAAQKLATKLGKGSIALHLDVADETNWQQAIEATKQAFGGLQILVNNAGIGSIADVETETIEGWSKVIATNETGVWLGMKHGGVAIKESGSNGSIINVSSIFGLVGGFGGSVAYHSAKGAVRLMTKNAALHWAKENIRVNSVHPGFIKTPLIAGVDEGPLMAHTPMGRLGTSQEVANCIVFLASDLSSYMSGSELVVDGGWTAE